MKRYLINIISLIALIATMSGCGKEMITYSGESGIFFDDLRGTDGELTYSFGIIPAQVKEGIVTYQVNLMGNVVDYDRPFKFRIIENDTAPALVDVDYKIMTPDPVIKAGEATGSIEIKLFRNRLVAKKFKIFEIQLVENEHFKFLYPMRDEYSMTTIYQYFDESVPYINWWNSIGVKPFGKYSDTKSNYICDLVNAELDPTITRERWYTSNDMQTTVGAGRMKYFGLYVQKRLDELAARAAETGDMSLIVMDEPEKEGEEPKPMRMGDISQAVK
ncbi:MAG: DUF4843 domain-containing protein [Odoribacter sp.]